MKEIVVISGKGGTGKTSLTASFAIVAKNSILADCDVDAPDLHLLLKPQIQRTHTFISGHIAHINTESCTSCGLCQDLCRFEAIESKNNFFHIVEENCEGCKLCVSLCPSKAIDFPDRLCGNWFESKTPWGDMVHACLDPGAENSGKLVSLVRKEARKRGEQDNLSWILVDGPPGIGCPVIASITGSDGVVLVTEPTPSGLHDLLRVLKLVQHFEIPAFVVINRFDINKELSDQIKKEALNRGAYILGEIPYSPLFRKAQKEGVPLIEYKPDSEEARGLSLAWDKLVIQLENFN